MVPSFLGSSILILKYALLFSLSLFSIRFIGDRSLWKGDMFAKFQVPPDPGVTLMATRNRALSRRAN